MIATLQHSSIFCARVKFQKCSLQPPMTSFSVLAPISAVAILGLELTFSEVSEDVGVVELCAVVYQPANIKCPIAFPFYIRLSTRDGTAGKRDLHVNYCILVPVDSALWLCIHMIGLYVHFSSSICDKGVFIICSL